MHDSFFRFKNSNNYKELLNKEKQRADLYFITQSSYDQKRKRIAKLENHQDSDIGKIDFGELDNGNTTSFHIGSPKFENKSRDEKIKQEKFMNIMNATNNPISISMIDRPNNVK